MSKASQVVGVSFPDRVDPGQGFTGFVTMRNIGTEAWAAAGGYKLGSQSPQDNVVWGSNRQPLPADVPPGAEVTIPLALTAPGTVGRKPCDWKMVQDGTGGSWFGETAIGSVAVGSGTLAESSKTLPGATSDPKAVVGGWIAVGGPRVADGLEHVVRWTNQTGRLLYLRKAYVWSGVQKGIIADVHAELNHRGPDGTLKSLVALCQWDRYAEPTAPNNSVWVDFDTYMTIEPGDRLELMYFMAQLVGTGGKHHHGAAVWVQYAPQE